MVDVRREHEPFGGLDSDFHSDRAWHVLNELYESVADLAAENGMVPLQTVLNEVHQMRKAVAGGDYTVNASTSDSDVVPVHFRQVGEDEVEITDLRPHSPSDVRFGGEPYYIDSSCPICGTGLVLLDERKDGDVPEDEMWHDEWTCPEGCLDDEETGSMGIILDVPGGYVRRITERFDRSRGDAPDA